MRSVRDRTFLLAIGVACMTVVTLASVTFGLLAREEAKALRVEVAELTIRAEKDAQAAHQAMEFVADLLVSEMPPAGSVTARELLESRRGQLEGQFSQELREAVEQVRESVDEQD